MFEVFCHFNFINNENMKHLACDASILETRNPQRTATIMEIFSFDSFSMSFRMLLLNAFVIDNRRLAQCNE